jgi:ectoine hydroxylase-related dioxygenase (phytanoyl-CoA dioxygenase family)
MSDFPIEKFSDNGLAIAESFYDSAQEIDPILAGIEKIISLLLAKYEVKAACSTPYEAMTTGYTALIQKNRKWGGEVYDAIKQIPAFMTLVGNARNSEMFRQLRPGAVPGVAAGGYGMRIDNPGEEKFRAQWHQEFPSQLRSLDGVVFWTPLLAVTPDMGPVEIAVGSHKEGLIPVYEDDAGVGKSGAYALHLDGEQERLKKYTVVAPCTKPGDLVLMDFLTMHQSGINVSKIPRWSIQFRLFNFADPIGIKLGWQGSFAAGQKFSDLVPELVATKSRKP